MFGSIYLIIRGAGASQEVVFKSAAARKVARKLENRQENLRVDVAPTSAR
jgi:hypothetical protein